MGSLPTVICMLLSLQQPTAPEMDATAIARANARAIQGLRSFRAVMEIRDDMSPDGGRKMLPEPELLHTITWYKQGDDERISVNEHRKGASGFLGGHDTYNGRKGYRMLQNYNPADPPPLSESVGEVASGHIAARKPEDTAFQNRPSVLLLMQFGHQGKLLGLEQLVAQSSRAVVKSRPAQSPRGCYELRLRLPTYDYLVSVDPLANFMVRRLEVVPLDSAKTVEAWVFEVESFVDGGNGAFLPQRSKRVLTNTKAEVSTVRLMRLVEHSINQELPPTDFEVRFPDWLRVSDAVTNKGYVWGPDGPRHTFASPEDYLRWYEPRMSAAQRVRSWRSTTWAAVLAGSTVGVAVLVILARRWLARRAGA